MKTSPENTPQSFRRSTRQLLILLSLIILFTGKSFATLLVQDGFNSTGNLPGTTPIPGGVWTLSGSANVDKIQLTSPGLTAPAGMLAAAGNKTAWAGGGESASSSFTSQTTGTVYYSFLIHFTTTTYSTGGTRILSLGNPGNQAASLAIRRDSVDASKFNFGTVNRQSQNGFNWAPGQMAINTTHFVVIAHQFVAGTANDVFSLWVNPTSFGSTPPAPALSVVNTSGDISSLNMVYLWQKDSSTPGVQVDELRVGTTWAEVAPASVTGDLTVGFTMGTYNFSWTFDKPVIHGTFVDGQPWVIRPSSGLSLVSSVPTRLNGQTVEGIPTGTPPVVPIYTNQSTNMTVINPPVSDWYDAGGIARCRVGAPNTTGAFGWDSRGILRSCPLGTSYEANLSWDGVTPKVLQIGDSVTTAYSRYTAITDTVLDAVAVLTVLDAPPPAGAFRPGCVRSPARRANPEWFTTGQLIDLTPYLITAPTTNLYGTTLVEAIPSNVTGTKLTSYFPGPSIMNHAHLWSRGSNATYNNSGATYGREMGLQMGDLAVGALADWLTPAQREQCRIQFIQRSLDTYESLHAGLYLTYRGGFLGGHAMMLTIAGRMLGNHAGLLAVNGPATPFPHNLAPEFYFSDFSQISYLWDGSFLGTDAPPAGPRRVSYHDASMEGNMSNISVKSATASDVTMVDGFQWPQYRAAREIPNLKLRVSSGTGAGTTVYTVTNIYEYTYADGTTVTAGGVEISSATAEIYRGRLTVKPAWTNGIPDSTSKLVLSAAAQTEVPRWVFKSGGSERRPNYVTTFLNTGINLSPISDYSDINAGIYLTLTVALYAIDGEAYFQGGADKWLIQVGKTAGYGEVLLSSGNSRNPAGTLLNPPTNSQTAFIGGLWRKVLTKANALPFAGTTRSLNNLPYPPAGTPLWLD